MFSFKLDLIQSMSHYSCLKDNAEKSTYCCKYEVGTKQEVATQPLMAFNMEFKISIAKNRMNRDDTQ
jgi:hypothetical protein